MDIVGAHHLILLQVTQKLHLDQHLLREISQVI